MEDCVVEFVDEVEHHVGKVSTVFEFAFVSEQSSELKLLFFGDIVHGGGGEFACRNSKKEACPGIEMEPEMFASFHFEVEFNGIDGLLMLEGGDRPPNVMNPLPKLVGLRVD